MTMRGASFRSGPAVFNRSVPTAERLRIFKRIILWRRGAVGPSVCRCGCVMLTWCVARATGSVALRGARSLTVGTCPPPPAPPPAPSRQEHHHTPPGGIVVELSNPTNSRCASRSRILVMLTRLVRPPSGWRQVIRSLTVDYPEQTVIGKFGGIWRNDLPVGKCNFRLGRHMGIVS